MYKVMIVDNESAIRKGLSHCIRWEMLDCEVVAQTCDGLDALDQLPAIQPDIVISDIRMPGMDGLELACHISQEYINTKVIILTGFPDFEYAQKAIEYGVIDFVLKPTSAETLVNAVEKAKKRIREEEHREKLAQELAHKAQQNLLLERGMLLHDLINRVDLSYLYVLNRMVQLNLDLSSYHVLRMDITPIDETWPQEQSLLPYLQQTQEVLYENLREQQLHQVYTAPLGDQSCYVIICTADTSLLLSICTETVRIIGSMPRFSLSIGISQHWTDPLRMADASDQADQAVHFARYTTEQPVIFYDQIPAIPPQVLQRVMHDLKFLKEQIEWRNQTGAYKILGNLFAFIRENRLPVENVRSICIYIYQLCLSLPFTSTNAEVLSLSELPGIKRLIEQDSVEQMEAAMGTFLEYVLQQGDENCADSAGVIRTVRAYITEHCAEDISLEALASLVYLSPTYLSRLFKRETGETLSTYIQDVRMERAKNLLCTTSMKIYEVAEQVGFSDPVYFSRMFKKATGVKPKDFRESTAQMKHGPRHPLC